MIILNLISGELQSLIGPFGHLNLDISTLFLAILVVVGFLIYRKLKGQKILSVTESQTDRNGLFSMETDILMQQRPLLNEAYKKRNRLPFPVINKLNGLFWVFLLLITMFFIQLI